MAHPSFWSRDADFPAPEPLIGNAACEVAVVGGGLTGLTAALLLARDGREVRVLERRDLAAGATGHSSGHLSTLPDVGYHAVVERYGAAAATGVARSLEEAVGRVESLASSIGAPEGTVTRVPGWLWAPDEAGAARVRSEGEAARRAGLEAAPAEALPLPWAVRAGLRVEEQARLHAGHYLGALARAAIEAGARVHPHTPVTAIRDGSPCVLDIPSGAVRADQVILATHVPAGLSALHPALPAYRSYLLAVALPEAFPEGLFWDTADPYHYVRRVPGPEGERVLVGGADHRTGGGDPAAAYAHLETWAREHLPGGEVVGRWSAQVYEPTDGLPFIGRAPLTSHLWVATGYAGDGLTFGTLAGWMLSRQVVGATTPYDELYHPARLKAAGTRRFLKANVAVARHFVADRLGRSPSMAALRPGEGAVVRRGARQVAAYREPAGRLRAHSAVCPHLKCVVQWNPAEETFDCPCHGSRFGTDGQVIEGCALTGLPSAESG